MDQMLLNLISPTIMVICYCVGVVIKKFISKLDNAYIPVVNAVLGIVIAFIVNGSISFDVIAQGVVSGWASTGLFESIRNIRGKVNG